MTYLNRYTKMSVMKNEYGYPEICQLFKSQTDKKLQKYMEYQSVERQRILRNYLNPNYLNPITQFGSFYNALVPEIVCPWFARVGNVDDGGKWVCNPWALKKNCIIYSLGVGPDISFEIEMDKITGKQCKIYSADANSTLGNALLDMNSNRFTFIKAKISKSTDKVLDKYSITDIKNIYKHAWIDILKIDIEGKNFILYIQVSMIYV